MELSKSIDSEQAITEPAGDDHVVVLVRALEHVGQHQIRESIRGGAGDVLAVGSNRQGLAPGDKVLFLSVFTPEYFPLETPMRADGRSCWVTRKPESLSYEEAASIPHAFATAAFTICSMRHETLSNLMDCLQNYLTEQGQRQREGSPKSAILILDGTSCLGAAIVQLLRVRVPDVLLLTTIAPGNTDENELTDLAIDQVLLGADLAIEHDARPDPDRDVQGLTEHLRDMLPVKDPSGVECIVDTMGELGGRGDDLIELFPDGTRKIFDVSAQRAASECRYRADWVRAPMDSPLASPGAELLMATLGGLLEAGKYRLPKSIQTSR